MIGLTGRVYHPKNPVPIGLGTAAAPFISYALIPIVAGIKGPGFSSLPVASITACLLPKDPQEPRLACSPSATELVIKSHYFGSAAFSTDPGQKHLILIRG